MDRSTDEILIDVAFRDYLSLRGEMAEAQRQSSNLIAATGGGIAVAMSGLAVFGQSLSPQTLGMLLLVGAGLLELLSVAMPWDRRVHEGGRGTNVHPGGGDPRAARQSRQSTDPPVGVGLPDGGENPRRHCATSSLACLLRRTYRGGRGAGGAGRLRWGWVSLSLGPRPRGLHRSAPRWIGCGGRSSSLLCSSCTATLHARGGCRAFLHARTHRPIPGASRRPSD